MLDSCEIKQGQCPFSSGTHLDLQNCNTPWGQVMGSQLWHHITLLNLSYNHITDQQLTRFAKLYWPQLLTLMLDANSLTSSSMCLLGEMELPKLSQLHLNQNKLGIDGFIKLMSSPFPNLKYLHASKCKISCTTLMPIPPLLSIPQLQYIDLSDNKIGALGVKLLTKAHFSKLKHLKLRNCGLSNQSATHLVKGNWKLLSELILQNNRIGFDGFGSLFTFNRWDCLYELAYRTNRMSLCAFNQIMVADWQELSVKTVDSDSFKNPVFRCQILSLYRRKFGD